MSGEELSGQQYQSVLKYMQAANQQNFENAVEILKKHQFSLQNAINSRFGDQPAQQQNLIGHVPNRMNSNAQNNQQEIRRYIQFLREKQNRSMFLGIFNFTKSLFCGLFGGLSELLLPEFIKKRIMRSDFYNNYAQDLPLELIDKTLQQLLRNNFKSRKPIMFLVGSPRRKNQCFVTLMNNPRIARKITQSFIVSGANYDQNNVHNTRTRFSPLQQEQISAPPSILIVRQTVMQKPQIVHRFTGQAQIEGINVETLNLVLRAHQHQHRKDRNILIKYRNHVRRQYYRGQPGFYEEEDDEQQEQYGLLNQPSNRRSSIDSLIVPKVDTSAMIQQQNEEYRQLEKITKQKQMRASEEMKKQEELQEQRKIRKMSLPDQPMQGDDIFRINFRCPDGTVLTRNFLGDQKIDLLYQWVETNQDIEFQDNVKRSFELLHSFPPTPLCEKRQEYLKNVFDSDQEKLMIREL